VTATKIPRAKAARPRIKYSILDRTKESQYSILDRTKESPCGKKRIVTRKLIVIAMPATMANPVPRLRLTERLIASPIA
jgi:hypothetical protein